LAGQSLEFSSGLFTNLNIETQREVLQNQGSDKDKSAPTLGGATVVVQQPEVVSFTVKCSYGAKPQAQAAANSASNQVAMKK